MTCHDPFTLCLHARASNVASVSLRHPFNVRKRSSGQPDASQQHKCQYIYKHIHSASQHITAHTRCFILPAAYSSPIASRLLCFFLPNAVIPRSVIPDIESSMSAMMCLQFCAIAINVVSVNCEQILRSSVWSEGQPRVMEERVESVN